MAAEARSRHIRVPRVLLAACLGLFVCLSLAPFSSAACSQSIPGKVLIPVGKEPLYIPNPTFHGIASWYISSVDPRSTYHLEAVDTNSVQAGTSCSGNNAFSCVRAPDFDVYFFTSATCNGGLGDPAGRGTDHGNEIAGVVPNLASCAIVVMAYGSPVGTFGSAGFVYRDGC